MPKPHIPAPTPAVPKGLAPKAIATKKDPKKTQAASISSVRPLSSYKSSSVAAASDAAQEPQQQRTPGPATPLEPAMDLSTGEEMTVRDPYNPKTQHVPMQIIQVHDAQQGVMVQSPNPQNPLTQGGTMTQGASPQSLYTTQVTMDQDMNLQNSIAQTVMGQNSTTQAPVPQDMMAPSANVRSLKPLNFGPQGMMSQTAISETSIQGELSTAQKSGPQVQEAQAEGTQIGADETTNQDVEVVIDPKPQDSADQNAPQDTTRDEQNELHNEPQTPENPPIAGGRVTRQSSSSPAPVRATDDGDTSDDEPYIGPTSITDYDHWAVPDPEWPGCFLEAPKMPGCGPWEFPLPETMDPEVFIRPDIEQINLLLGGIRLVIKLLPPTISVMPTVRQRVAMLSDSSEDSVTSQVVHAARWKAYRLLLRWAGHVRIHARPPAAQPKSLVSFLRDQIRQDLIKDGELAREYVVRKIAKRLSRNEVLFPGRGYQIPERPSVSKFEPSKKTATKRKRSNVFGLVPEDRDEPHEGGAVTPKRQRQEQDNGVHASPAEDPQMSGALVDDDIVGGPEEQGSGDEDHVLQAVKNSVHQSGYPDNFPYTVETRRIDPYDDFDEMKGEEHGETHHFKRGPTCAFGYENDEI